MALTEATAFELIRDHASILHQQLYFAVDEHHYQHGEPIDQHAFPLLYLSHHLQNATTAARVRLALDLLNTLCACALLDPVQNQRFWRRVLCELLLPRRFSADLVHDHELPPCDALAFSRFAVNTPSQWDSPTASDFWRDLICCGVATSDIHRERERLAQRLAPHVVMRNVRPLTLVLKRCSVGWDTRPQWLLWETLTVNTIVQCAADLNQRRQAAAMQMSGLAQSLPVLSVLSDVRLRFTLRQLHSGNIPVAQIAPEYQKTELLYRAAKPVVTVDAVTFGVGTKYARARLFDRVNTLRALGALLRLNYFSGFPEDTTTRSLELLANSFSHQVLGATLSVVPHAIESLTRVLCTSVGLQEKLLQLAWLAYALYHPRRQMRFLESVEIYLPITALNRSEVQYVEEIIRSGMPLRDVVGVALFNRYGRPRTPIRVDCFSLGVVVSIPQGTLLYYEPGRRTAQYLVATLELTVQVEVVAQLPADGFLGVVYPGFGLVWVDQAVVAWMAATAEYPSTDGAATATVGSLLTTTQLQLHFYKYTPPRNSPPNFSTPISPLRLFLGSQLRTLAVLDYSPLTREDLELILMSCPWLWRLEIRQCTIESLWPLLDAYFADPPSQCRVSSLRLASDGNAAERSSSSSRSQPVVVTPVDLFGPLMEALCDATHPLTLTLRDLNVDLRETPCEDTNVRHLIRALRGNTTKLERLVVKSAAASTAHVARELARFRDQVLVNGSAMRLAFMGVLRRCGLWGGRLEAINARVLSEETVRTVFAFTGGSVVRRVSWTSKKRTRSP